MSLVRLSGEAFGRHTPIFRPRRGLQDMKKVEADRLLDLHRAAFRPVLSDIADPDVAAAPEIVQILLLRGEELLEPLAHYAIHRPLGTAAEFFRRSCRRRVVNHIFGKMDRTTGVSVDCEGYLAAIFTMGNFVGLRARGL